MNEFDVGFESDELVLQDTPEEDSDQSCGPQLHQLNKPNQCGHEDAHIH